LFQAGEDDEPVAPLNYPPYMDVAVCNTQHNSYVQIGTILCWVEQEKQCTANEVIWKMRNPSDSRPNPGVHEVCKTSFPCHSQCKGNLCPRIEGKKPAVQSVFDYVPARHGLSKRTTTPSSRGLLGCTSTRWKAYSSSFPTDPTSPSNSTCAALSHRNNMTVSSGPSQFVFRSI